MGSRSPSQSPGALLTLSQLLRVGSVYLPPGLVSPAARRSITRANVELPACFSYGCYELRVDGDPRVDLLACALRADGATRALRRADVTHPLLRWWARSPTARPVEAVWLELDRPPMTRQPPPFFFLRFGPNPSLAAATSAATALGVTDLRQVKRCVEALQPGEQLLHFATMPHRDHRSAPLRVHVGLTPARVLSYLAALGWSGPVRRVAALLGAWPKSMPLGVQLDLGDDVQPHVDLELYLPTAPADDARWQTWFDRVAPHVDPTRLALAARWPGVSARPRHWPMQVVRRLQLKARVRARGPVEVKAYLGFSPRLS